MEENVNEIIARMKTKRHHSLEEKDNKRTKYINHLFSRVLLAIILLLCSVIYVKHSLSNKEAFQKYVFDHSISFAPINHWYQKNFGNILPFDKLIKEEDKPVFNENLVFQNSSPYHGGLSLEVGKNYLIPAIESGIVVFIGEKENFKNTIIIQGIDGVDIWYGNVVNADLTLYDYVEKGKLIAESADDHMYLSLIKGGEYIDYETYKKD